jgi:membrane-associated protease RseP (regulator of RpoE activity)
MKSTCTLAASIAIALAAPTTAMAVAADPSTPAAPAQVQEQATGGYLGVLLEPVPDALRAQLGSVLPSGQGVLIRDVEGNSPAAQAGLKVYDIPISFNDQKIFSAQQLTRLVRADGPDKIVTLRVVRNGTAQDIKVTLGKAQVAAESALRMPMDRQLLRPYATFPGTATSNWESFDSISLKKLEDGNFKAEIQYFGKDGKLLKQEFTGTRDAIREQIAKQPDLPSAERNQLLEALSARDELFAPPPLGWIAPGFLMPPWFSNWQPDF